MSAINYFTPHRRPGWKYAHKKQTQKQAGNSELVAENERLKAQLKRAEMGRDILKKSIAIFTQPT